MRNRTIINWKLFIVCGLFILMLCPSAFAEESAQVRIPVLASGADCTAELYSSDGNILQTLSLKMDEMNAFVVDCIGLKRFTYTVRLVDQDTDMVKYDHTQYHVHIDLFYGNEDQIIYSITVDELGVLGQASEGKKEEILFKNIVNVPTPTPGPTPVPYDKYFTFTKIWQGDHEDSIDWVMYNPDGTVRHKLFNKVKISDTEWRYEAWFQATEDIENCYIVEVPPEGYLVRYENTDSHENVTNHCYNGGTIINYKVPKTQDTFPLELYTAMVVISAAGLVALLVFSRKKKNSDDHSKEKSE